MGATVGATFFTSEDEPVLTGAAIGGAAAAAGTLGGYGLRLALNRVMPNAFAGSVGDALAVVLSLWVVRR